MGKPARTGLRLWDRFVLLAAWLVTCGLVYLLGFYTGKGTQERQLGLEERLVRLPVTAQAPAAGQRPKGASDLTFYEKLVSGGSGEGAAPAPKPPAPAADTAAPPAATAKAAPPAQAPPSTTAQPQRKASPSTTLPPATAALSAPPPASAPPPTSPPPSGVTVAPRAGSPWWTVTANPTRERAEAEDLMYRLKGRGYPVTLVRVLRDNETWYRLQVGRFASAEQANEIMRRLRDQEGVAHAFVASE
jgi:septal ring-binding cell division protein DamX